MAYFVNKVLKKAREWFCSLAFFYVLEYNVVKYIF